MPLANRFLKTVRRVGLAFIPPIPPPCRDPNPYAPVIAHSIINVQAQFVDCNCMPACDCTIPNVTKACFSIIVQNGRVVYYKQNG